MFLTKRVKDSVSLFCSGILSLNADGCLFFVSSGQSLWQRCNCIIVDLGWEVFFRRIPFFLFALLRPNIAVLIPYFALSRASLTCDDTPFNLLFFLCFAIFVLVFFI